MFGSSLVPQVLHPNLDVAKPFEIDPHTMFQFQCTYWITKPSSKLQEATWGFYVNAFVGFEERRSILHLFSWMDQGAKNYIDENDLYKGFVKFYEERTAKVVAQFVWKRHKMKPIRFSEFVAICTNR